MRFSFSSAPIKRVSFPRWTLDMTFIDATEDGDLGM
jgi:hypothetical protein